MPFRSILAGIAALHDASVRGAIFCDEEGERVEAVLNDPELETFDLDLHGASYAGVVQGIERQYPAARLRIKTEGMTTWLQLVRDGYYVVVLTRGTGLDHALDPLLEEIRHALLELM
jgi:hypothetical protein